MSKLSITKANAWQHQIWTSALMTGWQILLGGTSGGKFDSLESGAESLLTGALALLVAALEVVRAVVGIDTTQFRQ